MGWARGIFSTILAGVVLLSFATFLIELLSVDAFMRELESNKTGLPEDSVTHRKAMKDPNFRANEYKGATRRKNKVTDEIVMASGLVLCASFFFVHIMRKQVKRVSAFPLTFVRGELFGVDPVELNYLSIFLTLNGMLIFSNHLVELFTGSINRAMKSVVSLIIIFLFGAPLFTVVMLRLMRIYGSKIVLACYLAYFIKAGVEFVLQTPVDMSEMQKVPIQEFSPTIQKMLISRGLENRVYKEIKPAKSINAALVGWGSQERIEIYGDHTGFDDKEFESVLLHEIGHSINQSLIRKITVLFLLKLVEMVILMAIYTKVASVFSDESITKHGAFLALVFVYLGLMSKWMMVGHKMTSQNAETAADMIAKDKNYGKGLSNVLYKICIGSREYLKGTPLFNSLMSYHPTAYNRIEYLN